MAGLEGCRYLSEECLDLDSLTQEVASEEDGAVCSFLGTARRWSEGKEVFELRYECYPEMADAVIGEILEEIRGRHEGVKVTARHRLGPCPLGEASVAVVSAAPHRGEAFAACREAIDSIKERAPIWKQEVYADGTAWVGDPLDFPDSDLS